MTHALEFGDVFMIQGGKHAPLPLHVPVWNPDTEELSSPVKTCYSALKVYCEFMRVV